MKNINNKNNFLHRCFQTLVMLILIYAGSGCRKLVEVDPPINTIVADKVYSNTSSASAALMGIYSDLSSFQSGAGITSSVQGLSFTLGLAADELVDHEGTNVFYLNNLSEEGDFKWTAFYYIIFRVNTAIEKISASSLIPEVKNRLTGEAKFLRAFCYFYMVNLFGDVPLLLTTDYKVNGVAPREDKDIVYQQIIKDLKEAQEKVGQNYVGADILINSSERARPNKSAATALLARIYLYTNDWENAEIESTKIIDNTADYNLTELDGVFLKNSREAIWQLQPVDFEYNTGDAFAFIPYSDEDLSVYLTDILLNQFESSDNRGSHWVKQILNTAFYYPFKYKIRMSNQLLEYLMVFRLGEQYLIRAEARTRQGNITGAEEDLFAIRNRAGLEHTTASNEEEMIDAIFHERQIELFSEWGHRWFDLKRTGKSNEVLSVVKGLNWQDTDVLFPIPSAEIKKNPSLRGHQNPGY